MTYKQRKNRPFSKATLYARKKWNNMFKIIKENMRYRYFTQRK